MEPKVEIISKEMIKPSSPTPNHLRTLKLSFLDQMSPPIYIGLLIFYQYSGQAVEYGLLKRSLSTALTHYYPFAGRVSREKFAIDCNDSGALFVAAKVDANLHELIRDTAMADLERMISPLGRFGSKSEDKTLVLALQVSVFSGGGFAVAAQSHHNAADAICCLNFMHAWAAATKGGEITPPVFCDLAKSYPPRHLKYGYDMVAAPEKTVTKRVVFDENHVEKTRHVTKVKDPTRVEAVSAWFMRRFRDMHRARGSKKPIAVVHAVNLRQKLDPPLPYHAFGNVSMDTPTTPVEDAGDMVGAMRAAIKKLDGDYVRKILGDDEYIASINKLELSCIPCNFSSVSRLPFYGVDYGWGRPVWVYPVSVPYRNFVFFMPTSSGQGIEALVTVAEEDAAFLECHLVAAKL